MQAPVQLDSVNVSTERVRQLYEAMPAVFARDIARAKGQPIPPQSAPNLKRERPGDEFEVAMKRRDTGESKVGMGMPPPATPSLPPKSISAPVQPFASVAPQGATPDRTRMLQMRQQQQAQYQSQPPQVQQSQVPAGQQISPSHGSGAGINIGAGVGSGQGQNQAPAMHPNIMQQVVGTYGSQGLAFIQQLHDPNSQFVKYMAEQIPNFMSLPLPQQLKQMQHAQVRLPRVVFTHAYLNVAYSKSYNRSDSSSTSNTNNYNNSSSSSSSRGHHHNRSSSSNNSNNSSSSNSSTRSSHSSSSLSNNSRVLAIPP
jgi:hypothetical protein